jgi:hypothetical protein
MRDSEMSVTSNEGQNETGLISSESNEWMRDSSLDSKMFSWFEESLSLSLSLSLSIKKTLCDSKREQETLSPLNMTKSFTQLTRLSRDEERRVQRKEIARKLSTLYPQRKSLILAKGEEGVYSPFFFSSFRLHWKMSLT